ncbi:uncharacterized protein LOC110821428 isoform X2 [Carica papaya]|uniref:uncharacterized protein LOC110821428 isoform X2 n=1 Tax=Carica papaya TaxID=3649 RepID=UPI000B8CFEF3|nr:uncharacterized protein LOC110821428 isoform X2 [Carica papaya]
MANPSEMHQERNHNTSSSFNGTSSTVVNPVVDSTGPTAAAMKHNPGISMDWTFEEQAILEEGLTKYSSEPSVIRYAKIALQLQNKTVRDVALRSRWMTW